jgi:hypothetical protein
MAVTVELKGKKLIISGDIEVPRASASGKSMVVLSTNGNIKTGVLLDGKELVLGLNVYYSTKA